MRTRLVTMMLRLAILVMTMFDGDDVDGDVGDDIDYLGGGCVDDDGIDDYIDIDVGVVFYNDVDVEFDDGIGDICGDHRDIGDDLGDAYAHNDDAHGDVDTLVHGPGDVYDIDDGVGEEVDGLGDGGVDDGDNRIADKIIGKVIHISINIITISVVISQHHLQPHCHEHVHHPHHHQHQPRQHHRQGRQHQHQHHDHQHHHQQHHPQTC